MFDTIKNVDNLTNRYLAIGQDMLQRLSAYQIPDSALPSEISTWILETTGELLRLMPETSPDYIKLKKIKTDYTKNQTILRPSAKSDILNILKNLTIAHDCVLAALNADYKNIPPENLARINYEQVKRASDFVQENIIKELIGKENGRTSKTVILNIYGKICLWIKGMIKLDGPECCLTLAASVRSILELYVDLNLIDKGIITNGVEKYFSFTTVEKWRSARGIVDIGESFDLDTKTWDEYLSKPENSALRIRLWGKTKKGSPVMPKHWTNRDLRKRVVDLNDPKVVETYFSSYNWCNWCVHSMYFDMINKIDNVHLLNCRIYELAYKMFRSATELMNDAIKVLPEPNLESSFKDIENKTFKCFFGEMVNAGQPTCGSH